MNKETIQSPSDVFKYCDLCTYAYTFVEYIKVPFICKYCQVKQNIPSANPEENDSLCKKKLH